MKSALFLALLVTVGTYGFTIKCDTFEVDDFSTPNLGTVTISGVGGSTNISVPSTGTYQTQVCFTPATITINSQTVSYPNSQVLTTATGKQVSVGWSSTNIVEIYDHETVNSPAQ